jgi:hypothetical protein
MPDPVIVLFDLGREANCVDCDAPAIGRRKNRDQHPTCLRCEAERLAMIQIIMEAIDDASEAAAPADTPKARQSKSTQCSLF